MHYFLGFSVLLLAVEVFAPVEPTVNLALLITVDFFGLAVVVVKYYADSLRMVDEREARYIQGLIGTEGFENLFILRETKWLIRLKVFLSRFGQPVAELIWNLVVIFMAMSGNKSAAKNLAGAAVFSFVCLCYTCYKFYCDKKAADKAFSRENLTVTLHAPSDLESVL